MKKLLQFIFVAFSVVVFAQNRPTTYKQVQTNLQTKEKLVSKSLVKNILFESIGPSIMSGRVVDLAVNENDPTEFYVAYASGGLWYTNNNGVSFTPVMDNCPTQNIGDIAVNWKTGTIWVGTGEKNSSRSSYAGIGILKSTDKGKSWINIGLLDSHHISRILINPDNENELIVAVIGHLYSPNKQRGIFKTTDGGKSWKKTLFIDENTGVIDVEAVKNNFNIMYAASWERQRKAWHFQGNGKQSAIYKSTDAGNSWIKITNKNNGFPVGESVGRIGLAVYDENIVYAFHDNQFRRKKEKKKKTTRLTKDDFKNMTVKQFLKLPNKKLNTYLKTNGFQKKYRAKNIKQMIKSGNVKPTDLASYLENANALLFDTPVIGAEVFKTINGGKSWNKTHKGYLDNVYFSYGYYFGEIRVHPKKQNDIYIMGVPILKSKDGGKTFVSITRENVHSDHQALWVNPNKNGHLINGNDGGVNMSYDDGESWNKLNEPSVGQFYTVYVDNQKPYRVYGGLQDNGVWVAKHNAINNKQWLQRGKNPYQFLIGGDGMQIAVDNRNPNIIYTGYQFGNYFRIDRKTGKQTYIQPKHSLGENPYRFNWQTPIQLSKHNQDILYLGGNKLHRSLNQGKNWEIISNDLTQGGKKGNVAYGTLTTISESPFQFGLIYVGSDDGLVHITKNGGGSWTKISNTFPKNLWVSRVIASKHKKERVFVTLNGYRFDDFTTYIYMSNDYGKSWENIGKGIPNSPVNVIKEDAINQNVLYVGTDNGLYASLDRGKSWQIFNNGLPNVAVHDIVIQARKKHLIVGTHGRSIYKANVEPLQSFKNKNSIFEIKNVKYKNNWGNSNIIWQKSKIPKIKIPFYSNQKKEVIISIYHKNSKVNSFTIKADKGFNYANYDLSFAKKPNDKKIKKSKNGKYYLSKGKYTVKIGTTSQNFEIK